MPGFAGKPPRLIDAAVAARRGAARATRARLVADSWRLVSSRSTPWPPTGRWKRSLRRPTRSPSKKPSTRGAIPRGGTRPRWRSPTARSRRCDQIYQLPTRPEVAEHFLARKACEIGRMPKNAAVPVRRGARRRVLEASDGARRLRPERPGYGGQVRHPVRLLYDDQFLYLGISCQDPDPAHLLAHRAARDGKVWDDNELESFRSPCDGKRICQFLLNHLGTACNIKIENSKRSCPGLPPGP